jgi:hypothetical protein
MERALTPTPLARELGSALTFAVDLGSLRSLERTTSHSLVLEGSILPETELEPTRQTLRLIGDDWPLPAGTELRSSADALGWLLVWADGRSYRTVPEGALLGLFQERRVDVMPRYDARVTSGDSHSRGISKVIESPLGRLELTLVTQSDWGDSGHLLCDVFMELLRARREPELCGLGEFPARARYSWTGGGELSFSVSAPKRRAEGTLTEFRMPPELPIWKPGEVPPEVPAVLARPGRSWSVQNHYDTPLFFETSLGDARWLGARSTSQLSRAGDGGDYAARDFLGRVVVRGPLKGDVLSLGTPLEAGL